MRTIVLIAVRDNLNMQNKPQMVEAVMFFNERGICKEMFFPSSKPCSTAW